MKTLTQKEYIHWAGENFWSYHDTVLLFHGINPMSCEDLYTLFYVKKSRSRKLKAIKPTFDAIFWILSSWEENTEEVNKCFFPPYELIREIYYRGIIPYNMNPLLYDLVNQRHIRENREELIPQLEGEKKVVISPQKTRQDNNSLKIIASLIYELHSCDPNKLKGLVMRLEKICVFKITDSISDDTIRARINEALALFPPEVKNKLLSKS